MDWNEDKAVALPGPKLDEGYRIVVPVGGGPSILLDRAALRQTEVQIRIGVKALRARGVEIGGLIIGPTIDWTANEIVIDGFVPVEIEYRSGPTFKPSDADVEAFKEALADAGDRAIGYFRSHLRDDSRVRAEDVRLLRELFPSSDSCYIPIEAGPSSPSIVNVYQVQQGMPSVLVEFFPLKESGYEIPMTTDISEMAPMPVEELSPVSLATPEPADLSTDETFSDEPPDGHHVSNKKRRYWIAAALATIAAGAATYTLRRELPRMLNTPRVTVQESPATVPQSASGPSLPAAAPVTPPTTEETVVTPPAKPTRAAKSRSKARRSKKAPAKKARSKKTSATATGPTKSDR